MKKIKTEYSMYHKLICQINHFFNMKIFKYLYLLKATYSTFHLHLV